MFRPSRFLLGLVPLALIGCGGSGSSGVPSAQHAVIDVAKAAHSYRYVTAMARLNETVLLSAPTGEKVFDPMLGVDYLVTVGENGVRHVSFTDPETDAEVGTADITITDGPPFPVSAHQTMNATFGTTHMQGELELVTQDEAGLSNEVSGEYLLTNPETDATFDLVTDNGEVSGTFDATVDDSDVVDFSGITVTPTFATNANFAAHGETGALTINADGSGQTSATTGSGTYTVRWTAGWILTLERPDRSTKVLGPVGDL